MTFTINAEITKPMMAPRVSIDTTQEASSKFKRTGCSVSPFIKKGKDGDAQPRDKPADRTPRLPIKIMDFEKDLIYVSNFIN